MLCFHVLARVCPLFKCPFGLVPALPSSPWLSRGAKKPPAGPGLPQTCYSWRGRKGRWHRRFYEWQKEAGRALGTKVRKRREEERRTGGNVGTEWRERRQVGRDCKCCFMKGSSRCQNTVWERMDDGSAEWLCVPGSFLLWSRVQSVGSFQEQHAWDLSLCLSWGHALVCSSQPRAEHGGVWSLALSA